MLQLEREEEKHGTDKHSEQRDEVAGPRDEREGYCWNGLPGVDPFAVREGCFLADVSGVLSAGVEDYERTYAR